MDAKSKKMLIGAIPLAIFTLIAIGINWRLGGRQEVVEGLKKGWAEFEKMTLTLILVFIIMGQVQVLCTRYTAQMKEAMHGNNGLAGGYVAGIFSPGIISALPIVKNMWENDYPKAPLLMFLMSSRLLNLQVMFMMVPMVGWRITGIQLATGAALAAVMFPILWFFK